MTRAKITKRVFATHQRHREILTILEKGGQPRSYLMHRGLSRSLKWLLDHGQAHLSRTGNVYITDGGRARLLEMR